MGRLRRNPAPGGVYTLCYAYDNDGNLLTKTDNRSRTATYTYESTNPKSEMELVISAMLEVVKEFNERSEDQIFRIGMLPESLSLDKLPAAEVFGALERIDSEVIGA